MPTKIQIIFYSMYGHIYKMAEAVAEGARTIPDTDVQIYQVRETLPPDILAKMGAADAKKSWATLPYAEPAQLADADAIILGIPTRYGLVAAQMQAFLDGTGQLWAKGALVGKLGSSFTSTAFIYGRFAFTCIFRRHRRNDTAFSCNLVALNDGIGDA